MDTTAILWIQSDGITDYIIDEYEDKDQDIYPSIEVVNAKQYKTARHFGDPYSGGKKSMQSAETVAKILIRHKIRMSLAGRVGKLDRINASRARLKKTIISTKCPLFLETIEKWRYKKVRNSKPTTEHSVYSHLGEAYGYYAVGRSVSRPNIIKSRYNV